MSITPDLENTKISMNNMFGKITATWIIKTKLILSR